MKRVLMALAITACAVPCVAGPAEAQPECTDTPTTCTTPQELREPTTETWSWDISSETAIPTDVGLEPLARDLEDRYEGPNLSDLPHPDPPCPPGG